MNPPKCVISGCGDLPALTPGDVDPGDVLVDPGFTGQPQNLLTENVLHDLRGAAFNGVGPSPQERVAHPTIEAGQIEGARPAEGVVVADLTGHALQVDGRFVDVLVENGVDGFAHRSLRSGVSGSGQLRSSSVGEPQHLGPYPQFHDLVTAGPIVDRRRLAVEIDQHRDGTAAPLRCPTPSPATTDGGPFVHQRGQRSPPALVFGSDAVSVGNSHIGQVDLVELCFTGDLPQRADLHSRGVHVEGEVGHALVFGHVGIAAGDEHAPVGDMGQGVPHLLAVDDPFLAVPHRPGPQPGEVGSGPGLGEQLAPPFLAGEHRSEKALPDGIVAMGHDGGSGQGDEELGDVGGLGPGLGQSPVDVSLPLTRHSQPSVADGKLDPGQPGVELMAPELLIALIGRIVVGQQSVNGGVDHGLLIAGVVGCVVGDATHVVSIRGYRTAMTSAADQNDGPVSDRSSWLPVWSLGLYTITAYGTWAYAFGVLMEAISDETGWTTSFLGSVYGVAMLLTGASAFWTGRLLDRFGPIVPLGLHAVVASGLMLTAVSIDHQLLFGLLFAVGAGLSGATGFYAMTTVIAARCRPDRPDRAIAVLTLIGAFCSPIYLPLTAWLLSLWPWRTVARALVLAGVVGALQAAVIVRRVGRVGVGDAAGTVGPSPRWSSAVGRAVVEPAVRRALIVYLLAGSAASCVWVFQVPMMTGAGLGLGLAGTLAGFRGFCQIFGRMGLTGAVERFGPARLLSAAYGLTAVGSLALLAASIVGPRSSTAVVGLAAVFALVAGTGLGASSPLQAIHARTHFDHRDLGLLMGLQAAVLGLAGALGPVAGALLRDASGGWTPTIAAVVAILAIGTGILMTEPDRRETEP